MGAGRCTWPPGETLRARPAMCGALGCASVNSGAANQRSPNDVDPFHKIPETDPPKVGPIIASGIWLVQRRFRGGQYCEHLPTSARAGQNNGMDSVLRNL